MKHVETQSIKQCIVGSHHGANTRSLNILAQKTAKLWNQKCKLCYNTSLKLLPGLSPFYILLQDLPGMCIGNWAFWIYGTCWPSVHFRPIFAWNGPKYFNPMKNDTHFTFLFDFCLSGLVHTLSIASARLLDLANLAAIQPSQWAVENLNGFYIRHIRFHRPVSFNSGLFTSLRVKNQP